MEKIIPGIIVIAVIVFELFGGTGLFVGNDKAVRALETAGYSNVTVTDKQMYFLSWKGCAESDSAKFVCEATNPAGKRVKVSVCSGFFKGATVRTD